MVLASPPPLLAKVIKKIPHFFTTSLFPQVFTKSSIDITKWSQITWTKFFRVNIWGGACICWNTVWFIHLRQSDPRQENDFRSSAQHDWWNNGTSHRIFYHKFGGNCLLPSHIHNVPRTKDKKILEIQSLVPIRCLISQCLWFERPSMDIIKVSICFLKIKIAWIWRNLFAYLFPLQDPSWNQNIGHIWGIPFHSTLQNFHFAFLSCPSSKQIKFPKEMTLF